MAAFSRLTERLEGVFKKLRGHGRLSEADIEAALREVRLALLEADVNYKVVKDFIQAVKERATGEEVFRSLTPAQTVIKIVHEELVRLMGSSATQLCWAAKPPTVLVLVGLQGSGKTTTAAKLARLLVKSGHQPLLVAADVYRPAAVKQLEVLGQQLQVGVFSLPGEKDPVVIARQSMEIAAGRGSDTVVIDTAGRLHVDDEMMAELERLVAAVEPQEVLLVADAMTGQNAVQVAEAFQAKLPLTGLILTKLDGDARGGAALSMRAVTSCPIKYVGLGEKLEALEVFHPDRMASRILGMGDVLSLIEKAQESVDQDKARELEKRLRQQQLTLEDFLEQLQQVKKAGGLQDIVDMLPGVGMARQLKSVQVDEKEFVHLEGIIRSMTPEERRRPEIINSSRKRRIAKGSGTSVSDVNRLLRQFAEAQKLIKQLGDASKGKKKGIPAFLGR